MKSRLKPGQPLCRKTRNRRFRHSLTTPFEECSRLYLQIAQNAGMTLKDFDEHNAQMKHMGESDHLVQNLVQREFGLLKHPKRKA